MILLTFLILKNVEIFSFSFLSEVHIWTKYLHLKRQKKDFETYKMMWFYAYFCFYKCSVVPTADILKYKNETFFSLDVFNSFYFCGLMWTFEFLIYFIVVFKFVTLLLFDVKFKWSAHFCLFLKTMVQY